LKQIRERTHAARSARSKARQLLEAAQAEGDTDAQAVASLAVEKASGEVEQAEGLEAMLLSQIAGVSDSGFGGGFLDDPQMVRHLELLAHQSGPVGNVMLGPFLDAEQLASSFGGGGRWSGTGGFSYGLDEIPDSARVQAPAGIVPDLYRPLSLLSLIPTAVMTGQSFTYLVEGGDLDEGAEEVEEGEIKPEGSVEFGEGEVRAVTIASWVKAHRAVLADLDGLQTLIRQRLTYLVQRRVETQILVGDGVDPNLEGIVDRDGVGTASGSPAADAILSGLTQVRLANATPTGVVIHPSAYESILTEKDGGGGRLDSPGALAGLPVDSIWGVPLIQTAAIAEDQAIVADWGRACTLFIREGLIVRTSDADQDDFIRNRVTVLAETRVGLMVSYPRAICVVSL
jgi:hypothetical protein